MKKNWFYLFALICSVALFTACSDDEEGGNETPANPWAGTYKLADYVAENSVWNDTEVANWPKEGALYTEWTCGDNYTEFLSALFRYLGGSILPNALNSVTLQGDGNIVADYVASPTIALDPASIMSIFFTGAFPTVDASSFPTSGFVTSPVNLATWSEANGQLTVKLNINEILNSAVGENPDLQELVAGILNMSPAELKGVLTTLLGTDLSGISDATITQLQGWVKNGIPMHIETAENGHTHIYLDKSAFDNLLTTDAEGNSDIIILWGALSNAGIIPEEAQAAGILFAMFGQYWPTTTTFNLGLDLVKQ